MKTTNPIAALFGHSPFKPVQEHMRLVLDCVAEVPGLFDALIAGDQEALGKAKEAIFAKEQAADDLENQLRVHLPRGLFMAVDRRDLLELLEMQDSMADAAQDIAGLLLERNMEVEADMAEPLREFVARCVETARQAGGIVDELDELVETGFRGREASRVEEMANALNQIEDETDRLGMNLARQLFANEDRMKPVSVMFWYQIFQWIGDIADYAEKVGDRLRLMIAH